MYPELLALVEAHRSTIVFVNNRRLAERLALRLNELAEREVARAHHGSLAREQRVLVEEDLKAGRIPCLVATSSLELGIDMGAVDLVIQVESPKSVARGLQRIGRAGHELNAVSKGRIFPKFRADLLESAVVARAMRAGEIEETKIPRNPLDVLAQQIVAIAVDEEITVDELHALVRRAYPFAELSRAQLENVLDMLAGRYPSDEFADLRPRIVWDRSGGTIRARDGARRLAVTNAGTIPDRGLFGVFLVDGGGRVGELDEEMVYEARAGQTFLLGASTWRIEEITRDRVLVSPAPGVPGAVPFWKGEGIGRPYELGAKIGAASRELAAIGDDTALERLRSEFLLDERAARNLLAFLRDQADATGAVPSDRTIVVERFRDEIGDWRVCILTPFGGRVHAPWAMAITARLRESLGLDVQSIWSDDGIAIHVPDSDSPPPAHELLVDPAEVEDLVVAELGETALFGARFRENAARSLLIPRRRPGQRTPLWQQRLKAQSLLQVARRYGSFPVVLETYRECLQDVFDLPALEDRPHRPADAAARSRGGRDRQRLPVQLVAPLRLRRDVHVRGRHPAGRAAGAGAVARPRSSARAARKRGAARAARPGRGRRGRAPAATGAADARRAARSAAGSRRSSRGRVRPGARCAAPRRAARCARADRRRGAADRRRGRGSLSRRARRDAARRAARGIPRRRPGLAPPARCPVRQRSRARSPRREAAERFGRDLVGLLVELEREEQLVRGELRPGGTEREWCDPDVLRRLRRASLAALRREVEPVEPAALARFLPSWHGVDRRASLREALVPLQALALPVALWERRAPAAACAFVSARAARRALRERRDRVGRRRARPRGRLLPRGRRRARSGAGCAAARG